MRWPRQRQPFIAFPADYRALVASGLMSGRARTIAASRTGAFVMGALMPGDLSTRGG
jgi:hypothetical protein